MWASPLFIRMHPPVRRDLPLLGQLDHADRRLVSGRCRWVEMIRRRFATDGDNLARSSIWHARGGFRMLSSRGRPRCLDRCAVRSERLHASRRLVDQHQARAYVIMCFSSYSVRAGPAGATSAICGSSGGVFMGVLAARVQHVDTTSATASGSSSQRGGSERTGSNMTIA
jgi:hypothetical protein